MANLPPLPPGFKLDAPGTGIPPLPPGFQLDRESAKADAAPTDQSPTGAGSAPAPGMGGSARAFQTGAMQGMTFGFADEILGTLMTPIQMGVDAIDGKGFDPGGSWNRAVEANRGIDRREMEADQVASTVGQIAGGLGTGSALARGGVTLMNAAKPTVASMATRGAVEGAAYGGLHGLGTGESFDDKLGQAVMGAGFGGALGGATGAIGGWLASRAAAKTVPSVDDLKGQAGALYDAAEKKGVTFAQPLVKQTADDIAATAISEGIDPTLHPRATAALKRLQEAGQTGMTVKNAQTMRRVISAAGKDFNNPDEARIASIMVDKFDDMVGNSVPELGQARALYGRAKRGELIETTIQKARDMAGANYSASGFENALRQQFKNLLTSKSALRGFSDEEVAAIRKVAMGGPVENVMRYFGKLAPTGVVSFMGAGGVPFMAGNAIGGPALGAAMGGGAMGAGFAARQGATAMTMNNANRAGAFIRSGGQLPQTVPGMNPAVTQALIAAEGTQARRGPQAPSAVMQAPSAVVQALMNRYR